MHHNNKLIRTIHQGKPIEFILQVQTKVDLMQLLLLVLDLLNDNFPFPHQHETQQTFMFILMKVNKQEHNSSINLPIT